MIPCDPMEMELDEPEVQPLCAFCDEESAGTCEICDLKFCPEHGSVSARGCYFGSIKVRIGTSRPTAEVGRENITPKSAINSPAPSSRRTA